MTGLPHAGASAELGRCCALERRLAAAFRGIDVAYQVATPEMYGAELFPEEMAAVFRARPSRRREFAAGRAAAHATLKRLGQDRAPLLPDRDRVPIWPPGFIGSISHCDLACCAVSAQRSGVLGVGVDLERATRLEEGVVRLVVDDWERIALASLPIAREACWPTIIFSAKEAFYKAYFPFTRTFLSFLDVSMTFTQEKAGEGTFGVRSVCGGLSDILASHPFVGRWSVADDIVLAVAAILQNGPGR